MEYRSVGRSGLQVSVVGLGCNNFGARIDQDASTKVVAASLDAGITFFDTSNSYGNGLSEEFLGAALEGHRDDTVIATKFCSPMGDGPYRIGASRKHVMVEVEASLRRLRTDYIDLYYLHMPDPHTPLTETLDVLDDLVRAGKVRYIASSNLPGWQIAMADHLAREHRRARFIASQIEWNLIHREVEADVVPSCRAHDVGIVTFYPLGSGLLTGKYTRGEPPPAGTRLAGSAYHLERMATDQSFDVVERLSDVGRSSGRSMIEMAIGWLTHQQGMASVLVGASTPEQVAANAAVADVTLSADELEAIGSV